MDTFPHHDLAAVVRPLVGETPVYVNWPSMVDLPCIVIPPAARENKPNCHARWTLNLDVVVALTGDHDFIHETVEAIVPNLGVGWSPGTTTYAQRSVGGADVIVATTPVQTDR